MKEHPLRTTVIGSYPFPAWLESAVVNLEKFGPADRAELIDDAVTVAIADQTAAGLVERWHRPATVSMVRLKISTNRFGSSLWA